MATAKGAKSAPDLNVRHTNLRFPVRTFSRLFHVGSMNPEDKGAQGASLEGHGLSVSLHPEDWTRIARLGGHPTWLLHRQGAKFLDVHKLRPLHRQAIINWGLEQGLVQQVTAWRAYTECDNDERRFSLHATREEALAEVDDEDGAESKIEEVPALRPGTELLNMVRGENSLLMTEDYLLIAWVERCYPGVDGLWWNDVHDPDSLSAPRGVILPGKLDAWTRHIIHEPKRSRSALPF